MEPNQKPEAESLELTDADPNAAKTRKQLANVHEQCDVILRSDTHGFGKKFDPVMPFVLRLLVLLMTLAYAAYAFRVGGVREMVGEGAAPLEAELETEVVRRKEAEAHGARQHATAEGAAHAEPLSHLSEGWQRLQPALTHPQLSRTWVGRGNAALRDSGNLAAEHCVHVGGARTSLAPAKALGFKLQVQRECALLLHWS